MLKNWFKFAFLNLVIIAIIGVLLRYAFISEISWFNYNNFKHAHSHVAMLGWVYLALYPILIVSFVPEVNRNRKYSFLFWLTQISVLGMLIGFATTGYRSVSIAFSGLHMLLAYVFVYYLFKDIKNTAKEKSMSLIFLKTSLIFMLLSSVSLWGMIPIILSGLQGEAIYYMSIQFFLHFQFNGWFIFAVIGIFLQLIERNNIHLDKQQLKRFFILLTVSCLLTYVLAVTWSNPIPLLFWINGAGVLIQLAACILFVIMVGKIRLLLKKQFSPLINVLFTIAFVAFVIKILVQTAVVIPHIAEVAYTVRNFVIGFLHLMLLGMITMALIGFGACYRYLTFKSKWARLGLWIFLFGIITTEILLALQGLMLWMELGFLPNYYSLLFGLTVFLPIGTLLIFTDFFVARTTKTDSTE